MRLVCHIGTAKTGTTFLQEGCAANAAWLARQGVVYPDLMTGPNHLSLAYVTLPAIHPFARSHGLRTPEDVEAFRRKLARRIRSQTSRRHEVMLVSTELLSSHRTAEGVASVERLLRPLFDDIRIVVYLRRQDEAVLSMYAETLRRGFAGPTFPAYLDAVLGPKSPLPYLDYDRMLGHWAAAFGKAAVMPRIYDRRSLSGAALFSDFLTAVLGHEPDLDGLGPLPETNVSLSASALEFLRRIHPSLPLYRNGEMNPRREALRARIDQFPALPRPRMSTTDARRIMAHFAPGNARVAAEWFPDRPAPLFPPPPRSRQREGNLGRISLDTFARLAGRLLE